jgi:hypothetical protein
MQIIALTGSDVTGPLGVAHLPRLWQLGVLARTDLLAERRTTDPRGFDALVTAGLGINLRELHGHLNTLPTYPATEEWVRSKALSLDAAAIERVNAAVVAANDNLAVWEGFHAWLLANREDLHDAIVPAISARSVGSIGLGYLARLWVKLLLNAADVLAAGYVAGRVRIEADSHGWRTRVPVTESFDGRFLAEFGVDLDAADAYVKEAWPTYIDFERWFVVNATKFGPSRVGPINAQLVEPSLRDDLRAWEAIHAAALATGIRPSGGTTGGRRR